MIVFLTAVIATFAFVLLVRVLWSRSKPKVSTTIVATCATLLIVSVVLLAASGRLHWIAAVGAVVFPFLRRGFTLLRFLPFVATLLQTFQSVNPPRSSFFNRTGARDAPQSSQIETDDLQMSLDHESGEIVGRVKRGKFQERQLRDLASNEIVELFNSLEDGESRRLLSSFIERYHPDVSTRSDSDRETSDQENSMTLQRAREILGVSASASREEIIEAHRRLIQKLHPDRGGSSYLAAELNEAKKVLIDEL